MQTDMWYFAVFMRRFISTVNRLIRIIEKLLNSKNAHYRYVVPLHTIIGFAFWNIMCMDNLTGGRPVCNRRKTCLFAYLLVITGMAWLGHGFMHSYHRVTLWVIPVLYRYIPIFHRTETTLSGMLFNPVRSWGLDVHTGNDVKRYP